jgi:hypothetical protein
LTKPLEIPQSLPTAVEKVQDAVSIVADRFEKNLLIDRLICYRDAESHRVLMFERAFYLRHSGGELASGTPFTRRRPTQEPDVKDNQRVGQ